MAVVEAKRIGPGAKAFFLCHAADGKQAKIPVPTDRRAFIPTLTLLRGVYGLVYACWEWNGDKRSRIGLSEEDAYGS